jgi:hypothetical protein
MYSTGPSERQDSFQSPPRCPLAPESSSFNELIRELLFGTGNRGIYRFLFTEVDRSVSILHVRHGFYALARTPANPNEANRSSRRPCSSRRTRIRLTR